MKNRKGEKIGWIGGWIGGFLWVATLAMAFPFQGKYPQGLSGTGLAVVAAASVLRFRPWRSLSSQCRLLLHAV